MDYRKLVETYPELYHMADVNSWPSIKKHGLRSTCALLDLFESSGQARHQLESEHRPCSVTINHPIHGSAVIRDQKPMSDSGLRRCLLDDLAPRDWYEVINQHVFFWFTLSR